MILRGEKEPKAKEGMFLTEEWEQEAAVYLRVKTGTGAAEEDNKEHEVRIEITVKMRRMGRTIGRTLAFTLSKMRNP